MTPIRVGMLGVGRITDLHYPAYQDFPDAELRWVCSADIEQARQRARQWNVPNFTNDYRDVLADPDVDMVEINTPHHLHHPMTLAAAAAGKHIQLQKPMARTIGQCREILAAVKAAGVQFKVMENFVFYPPYRLAKKLLDDGEIGELRSIRIRLGSGGTGGWWVPLDTWIWRLSETEHGGGPVIYDDGYHKFSIGMYFGGPVRSVHAWIDRSMTFIDAPAVVSWEAESGVLGVIDATFSPNLNVSSNYYSADERVELTGAKGVIHITRCTGKLLDEAPVLLHQGGSTRAFHDVPADWVESFKASTRDFIRCLMDGGRPSLTGEEALAVQQFCFAAIRSAKEGRPLVPADMED